MGEVLPLARDTEFAAVVRAHDAYVRARLRRLGLFAADVEDCVQEAFVKAWQLREQMPSDLETRRQWLGRIAFNASCRRRREVQRMHYVDGNELTALAGDSRSNADVPAMLAEMLERLPDRYHEMMRLRAQGYSIDDIAKHYGIPWSTANSRWVAACVAMGARS